MSLYHIDCQWYKFQNLLYSLCILFKYAHIKYITTWSLSILPSADVSNSQLMESLCCRILTLSQAIDILFTTLCRDDKQLKLAHFNLKISQIWYYEYISDFPN